MIYNLVSLSPIFLIYIKWKLNTKDKLNVNYLWLQYTVSDVAGSYNVVTIDLAYDFEQGSTSWAGPSGKICLAGPG